MRKIYLAAVVLGMFATGAMAELNVPNATVKPTPAAPAAGVPGTVPPGLPVPPPVPVSSALPHPGMPPLGTSATSASKSIDDVVKGMYVAAILGDTAILRIGATQQGGMAGGMTGGMGAAAPAAGAMPGMAGGAAGMAAQQVVRRPMYQVKHGVTFKIDDNELIPAVTDRQVTLTLASKKGRVVYVGYVDALPLPIVPQRYVDVTPDNNFARQHTNVDLQGGSGGASSTTGSGSSSSDLKVGN